MGTPSGANFQHQQPAPQVEMPPPPPCANDRPAALQMALSLSGVLEQEELLSNLDPGHHSDTESAGSGEPGECGGSPPLVAVWHHR
ncbi:unnamed protein product [Urochloa humidicola]